MAGDVESNPGPETRSADVQTTILATVQRIEEGQTQILSEVRLLKDKQKTTDTKLQQLSDKVTAIEAELAQLKSQSPSLLPAETIPSLESKISHVQARCDDAENRLRRCNILFYGIEDSENETWAMSEGIILEFCMQKLKQTISSDCVERAHRLGRFSAGRNRPIIVKLSRFKEKDCILMSGPLLKGTPFAVGEDFSLDVRIARRKLLHFAKERNMSYKLTFNKLKMENRIFVYNPLSDSVEQLTA